MPNKKAKVETQSPLRTPKPKNKLGLSVPKITMPHEIFVKAEDSFDKNSPITAIIEPPTETHTSLTSQTSVSRQTRQTSQTNLPKLKTQPNQTGSQIAPERNFQKVPNSIVNVAIPAGIFKGKSKLLYDVLYAMTRGAVVPRRTARARKTELMKKAGIGSRVTFDSNMQHLIAVGLVREKILIGEHDGNEFEVYTVEEVGTLPSLTSVSSLTSPSQNLVSLVTLETSQTRQSLTDSRDTTYENFKTLFKDFFKTDDEKPLVKFLEKLNEAALAATGKDLTQSDFSALVDIADLIVSETEVARSRTSGVSVYLKFAAENLRRRLYAKNSGTGEKKPGELKTFSEPSNSYEPEPLGDERFMIIENLRRIAEENGSEAVKVFCGNYTEEDWQWLMNNL
jgi:hypothetical protein